MSRDLNYLDPEFKSSVMTLLGICNSKNTEMVVFSTVRSLSEQARLYRQSRTWNEIKRKIDMLRSENASYLAEVLESVGPQKYSRWQTNAIPGMSWHNLGLACDCFVLGRDENNHEVAIWDVKHPGYTIYAVNAVMLGLTAGFYWSKNYKDPVHIQKYKISVLDYFGSYEEIEKEIIRRGLS